jgi:enhancing lycopene biosynthesis protein 2
MTSLSLGIVLSGTGHLDGTDVEQSVLVQLALAGLGVPAQLYAPDLRFTELDHSTGQPTGAERQVLKEAARLSRGVVRDLATAKGTDHEGWILPGGGGATRNLCDFATKGAAAAVNKEVNRVLREAFAARIPVGACGAAAIVVALVARGSSRRLRLTLGADPELARTLEGMGHTHAPAGALDVVVDTDRKIVTTPAGGADGAIDVIATGIHKMVKQVVDWSREELSAPRSAPR